MRSLLRVATDSPFAAATFGAQLCCFLEAWVSDSVGKQLMSALSVSVFQASLLSARQSTSTRSFHPDASFF